MRVFNIKLNEANRNFLINKSKSADSYVPSNQLKGKNRYERRLKSKIANSVAQYNKIDMDAFFKRDILTVGVLVHGETSDYTVTVRFKGVLREVEQNVKANKGLLEFKVIARSISKVFNSNDIDISCDCPDSKYRQRYYQWKNGYGTQYEPRPSKITNPKDTKGAGCKHTLLVLSNLDWVMKVASVVLNYIKYCQKNMAYNYSVYMFPKIYGMPYGKAVQTSMFELGWLPSDTKTIGDIATKTLPQRNKKGQWVTGNEFRFQKKEEEPQDVIDDNQEIIAFDNDEEENKTT